MTHDHERPAEAGPMPDPGAVAETIGATAREVVMPRWRQLRPDQIREKAPNNLVTVADTECEALLAERLLALLPGSTVVGEEAVEADRTILRRLGGPEPVWIIDPVDGTSNFAQGSPQFAVLVALAVAGRPIAGWLHQPATGDMAVAVAGHGVTVNGAPATPARRPPERCIGAAYGKLASGRPANKAMAKSGRIGGISNAWCGGVDYIRILKGELDFFYSTGALAWDHAAGMLAVAEAGGTACQLSGDAYSVLISPGTQLLAAGSAEIWTAVKALAEAGAPAARQGWLW